MADTFLITADVLTLLLSAFATVFAWGLYKTYRELSGGPWLPVSFFFMFLNRVAVLAGNSGMYPDSSTFFLFLGAIFFFIFNVVLFYSLWRMKNEGDELLKSDKQAMKTIIEFEKNRKRKHKQG